MVGSSITLRAQKGKLLKHQVFTFSILNRKVFEVAQFIIVLCFVFKVLI